MTLVAVRNIYFPSPSVPGASFTSATGVIDATGEKYAWIGRVYWADRSVSSRDIRRARFLFGPVTKAGGSGLTFSLQNIDAANGPPGRPDGTQDQTVAIANGNASFASNTYFTTGNLSADRTVSYGELLTAVLEYDGSGRLGSDSVAVYQAGNTIFSDGPALFTASWATNNGLNGLVFEFADGEVGVLGPSLPLSAATVTLNLSSSTTPDEVALKFTPTFACKVDGLWAAITQGAGADMDLVLYQGTTALQTASVDSNTTKSTSAPAIVEVPIPETTLTAGTAYYVAAKPTTTNQITARFADITSTAVMACLPCGAAAFYSARTDAGSWSDTTTRYPMLGVRLSAVDNGASAGGSGGARLIGGTVVR